MNRLEPLDDAALEQLLSALRAERTADEGEGAELTRVLHDLQVYQIELEQQNRELRETQRALELSADRYADLYDWAPVGYCTLDRSGTVVEANLTAARLLEVERGRLVGRSLSRRLCPGQHQALLDYIQGVLSSNQHRAVELRRKATDGRAVELHVEGEPARSRDGEPRCRVAILDVTERKTAEREQADATERLELALAGGDIGLYEGDLASGRIRCDARCLAMLGYGPDEVPPDTMDWSAMVHPEDRPKIEEIAERMRHGDNGRFEAEYRLRHRDGEWIWVLDRGGAHGRDADTGEIRFSGTRVDVTRRKQAELSLEYLADHDTLTGLFNRRGVDLSLRHSHAQCVRTRTPHCVSILDLDHFKRVNDTRGHLAGDQVLRVVAERLLTNSRDADWIGRWGGEEFLVFLHGATEAQAVAAVDRLRWAVAAEPIWFQGQQLRITLSAGIAACDLCDDTPDAVLGRADTALFLAKQQGRNRTCVSGWTTRARGSVVPMAVVVQDAIRAAELHGAYQPIVDLEDRRFVGEETLARILTSDGRILPADSFIGVAQDLGLLHRIDEMLFRAALRHRAEMPTRDGPLSLFVNLSGDLLHHPARVAALAERLPLPTGPLGARMVVTVSEYDVRDEGTRLARSLAPFLEHDCLLAIRDWSGDAAALERMHPLPISFIRFDPGLSQRAPLCERTRTKIQGVQQAAMRLGIICIAHHIEDEETANVLHALGVCWGQGFLFGRPSDPVIPPPDTPA